jgi:hypothetical protein
VSAAVNRHYGTEYAVQFQYAPLGVPSGLCAALATTAYQNEGLTLQPCSVPAPPCGPSTRRTHLRPPEYFPLVKAPRGISATRSG